MDNLYSILGLPNFSSEEEVKHAFKRLAMLYHPDRNPDNAEAEEKFKMINQAYQILAHPIKKSRYDQMLLGGAYYFSFNTQSTENQETQYQQAQEQHRKYRQQQETAYQRWKLERGKQERQAIIFSVLAVAYFFIIVNTISGFYARTQYFFSLDAYKSKQYDKALHYLRTANGADNAYARAYFLKGQIYREHYDYNGEAVANFTLAIEHIYQVPTDYFYQRALAYTNLREESLAEKDFKVVLEREPTYDKEITKILAEAYYKRFHNYDKGIQQYKKYLSYVPNDSEAYQNLGFMYKEREQYEEAIIYFTKFLDSQQSNYEILYERAICFLYIQNVDKCCLDWQRVKSLSPMQDASLDFFCKRDSVKTERLVVN